MFGGSLEDGDRVAGENVLGLRSMQQLQVLRDVLDVDQTAALLLDRPDLLAGVIVTPILTQTDELGGEVVALTLLA